MMSTTQRLFERRRFVISSIGIVATMLLVTACGARVGTPTDGGGTDAANELTASCVSNTPTAGITDDTITIGTSMPITGALATAGTTRFGMLAYFEYLNDQGGVDGRQIDLIVRDDAYDPSKVSTNVEQLLNEEDVFAIVGLLGTAGTLAVQQDLQDNCVPNLFVLSGAPIISDSAQTWTTPMFPTYSLEAQALAQGAIASGAKTVSIISENDDFGKAYVDGLVGALEGTGIEVTQQQTYDVGAATVDAQITQLADDSADAVLVAALGTKCPQILNGIAASGWDPQLLVGTLCTTKGLLTLLEGDAGADMVSTAWYKSPGDPAWADDEAMTLYRDSVLKYQPEADPNEDFVLNGWLLAQAFAETLKNSDALDRVSVMESARNSDIHVDTMLDGVQYVTGPERFEPIDSVQLQRFDAADQRMEFIDPETGEDLASGQTALYTGEAK